MNPATIQTSTRLTPTAVAELRTLSPQMLSGLPLATELRVKLRGHGQVATFQVAGQPASTPTSGFDVTELLAIAGAVEHGRASGADIARWCERKAADPAFRVTPEVAFSEVATVATASWSLGAVLREIDAVIIEATIADDASLNLPVAA